MLSQSQVVIGDALGQVTLFATLSDELRSRLVSQATPVRVDAGAWLFRAGDEGDSLFVVLTGRLEVVRESPEPVIVRTLGRGDAFGELALLTGAPRSASVRARRDSELLKLSRDDFLHLLRSVPDFSFALTKLLGQELRESGGPLTSDAPPIPSTVALVPMQPGLPTEALARGLLREMARWHTVARLDPPAAEPDGNRVASYVSMFDRCERSAEQVVLVAEDPGEESHWTDFCLRQADRVLVLAGEPGPSPGRARLPGLKGCDIVYCPPDARGVDPVVWHDALRPRASHLLPIGSDFDAAARRIARRLAGTSIGVVLSGGGARGLAHIGVLEELLAAGVVIDRVAGCSMGSFVGAQLAAGADPSEIRERCAEELVRRNPWSDYTFPLVAATRGRRLGEMLERVFGSRHIQQLEHAYFCVSADLLSSELIVHDRGALAPAVAASMCIPGSSPPVVMDGRVLVDGGLFDNLPVETMASFGEGPIIAVDVTAQLSAPAGSRRGRPRARRLRAGVRKAIVGDEVARPGLRETLFRAVVLGSRDTTEAAKRYADLVISPQTGSIGLIEFDKLDRARELGRSAARAALEASPQLLERPVLATRNASMAAISALLGADSTETEPAVGR
jgi:NTE family protein